MYLLQHVNIKKYIPILDWLPAYQKQNLSGDLSAGLTVGVLLIPQGMAYAMLAGLPAIYGLYTATIPIFIYAIFGTSRQIAVGPVAVVALLTANGVGHLAPHGTPEYVSLVILLTLMVGVIQLLFGVMRLGFIVNFMSHPVVVGYISAVALIIGFNQLKYLMGVEIARNNHIHVIMAEAFAKMGAMHWETILLGIGGLLVIVFLKKINRHIPGSLIAVIVGILAVQWLNLDAKGVAIVGNVPAGLPVLSVPSIDWKTIKALMPAALTISLIGYMESIAIAKTIRAKHKDYELDANQELIAFGWANILGTFFGSFPAQGGVARSAINDSAGARTQLAGVISGILILVTLLFLTPLFYYLPKAILASLILVAVAKLVDFKEFAFLWRRDKKDLAMMVITFLGTLTIGIEEGIALGIVLSLALILYKSSYPHHAILGRIPGTNIFRNIKRFPNVELSDEIAILRFDAQLFFANVGHFKEQVENITHSKPTLKYLVISSEAINSIDSTAIHVLEDMIDSFKGQGIQLVFSAVKGPMRDILHHNGLFEKIGAQFFFASTAEAIECIENKFNNPNAQIATQAED